MFHSHTGSYPAYRPRRLRNSPALRRLVQENHLNPSQFVLPLFTRHGSQARQPVRSMPGVFQLSPDEILKEADEARKLGIGGILLFGIPDEKDENASEAYNPYGAVQEAVRMLKKEVHDFLVITDVCLCEYMSHGHCGLIRQEGEKTEIVNDPTLELLARTALSHAEAGADMVAPSDMMDGRIAAIRQSLDRHGFSQLPILSYAAKYSSAFYGPFREAAESAPQFGDRRSYQMNPANSEEALREIAMDIQEGADMVMVKPGLAYLDVLHRVKQTFRYPTAAYAVSGEYSMIKAAAERGWIDERAVTLEVLTSMKRAGADLIITYAAKEAAKWLRE